MLLEALLGTGLRKICLHQENCSVHFFEFFRTLLETSTTKKKSMHEFDSIEVNEHFSVNQGIQQSIVRRQPSSGDRQLLTFTGQTRVPVADHTNPWQ